MTAPAHADPFRRLADQVAQALTVLRNLDVFSVQEACEITARAAADLEAVLLETRREYEAKEAKGGKR